LFITALVEGHRALGDEAYLRAAEKTADMLLATGANPEGAVWRVVGNPDSALGLLASKTVYKMGIDALSNPSFDYGYGGWHVEYSANGSATTGRAAVVWGSATAGDSVAARGAADAQGDNQEGSENRIQFHCQFVVLFLFRLTHCN